MSWLWSYLFFTPWVEDNSWELAGSKPGGAGDGKGRS